MGPPWAISSLTEGSWPLRIAPAHCASFEKPQGTSLELDSELGRNALMGDTGDSEVEEKAPAMPNSGGSARCVDVPPCLSAGASIRTGVTVVSMVNHMAAMPTPPPMHNAGYAGRALL